MACKPFHYQRASVPEASPAWIMAMKVLEKDGRICGQAIRKILAAENSFMQCCHDSREETLHLKSKSRSEPYPAANQPAKSVASWRTRAATDAFGTPRLNDILFLPEWLTESRGLAGIILGSQ